MSLELNLRRHGVKVMTAASGNEALSLLRQYHCKLLITDYIMEGITGIELLQQARQFYPDIKVIIFSGYADEALKETIIQEGADLFLWKPVTIGDLLEAIQGVMQVD